MGMVTRGVPNLPAAAPLPSWANSSRKEDKEKDMGGEVERIREQQKEWTAKFAADVGDSSSPISTESGVPVVPLATPADIADFSYERDLGFPGEYPYTRGPYTGMYRKQLWTRRAVSGYGGGGETNPRQVFLQKEGATGLNLIVDIPTMRCMDPDDPRAEGETGINGVNIATFQDVEELFEALPIDRMSVSVITGNSAPMIMAMYFLVLKKRGIDPKQAAGSVQNDVLKDQEVIGCSCGFGTDISLKLAIDLVEFCLTSMPRWNFVTFNEHACRENGVTAAQGVGYILANAKEYSRQLIARGHRFDDFAPRYAFFMSADINFFEEIAKYRAARRIWARIAREEFGCKDPRSERMRIAVQTGGSTLTAQQLENNIVRVALESLAGVLGGCQSLSPCAYDEAVGLPTEKASKLALRTQEIIAYESGIADTIDPLGGSYYVEYLTNEMEKRILGVIAEIDDLGGALQALRKGFFERDVWRSAMQKARKVQTGEKVVVGVNKFVEQGREGYKVFRVPPGYEDRLKARVKQAREQRDPEKFQRAMDGLRVALRAGKNVMPEIFAAVEANATVGEMGNVIREFGGSYVPHARRVV